MALKVKELFFDRGAVLRAVERAKMQVMSRKGALVQKIAQQSIRAAPQMKLEVMTAQQRQLYYIATAVAKKEGRKKPQRPKARSQPGHPPYSWTGLLRRFIYFAYDPGRESVVIGPVKLPIQGDVPHVLEFGGQAEYSWGRGRTYKMAPRPYMGPALETARPYLAKQWHNSVKG